MRPGGQGPLQGGSDVVVGSTEQAAGSREILLVEAQEELVAPTRVFAVEEV